MGQHVPMLSLEGQLAPQFHLSGHKGEVVATVLLLHYCILYIIRFKKGNPSGSLLSNKFSFLFYFQKMKIKAENLLRPEKERN